MQRSQISAIVALLALLVTPIWAFAGMMDVPFHGDESQNIYMARYFDLYFLQRDFSNPEWSPTVFWATTHPPVSKYLIGLALFVTGYDFSAPHQVWNWGLDEQTNWELGNVPSTAALAASRSLMTTLFALSIVLCAAIAYRLGGFVGAVVAGPLFATSDLALKYLRRVTPDAPVLFFSLLAVLSSTKLLTSLSTGGMKASGRSHRWAALTGLWIGLAGGSKLSAASLVPVLLFPPAIAWFVLRSGRTPVIPARRLLVTYAILLMVATASFIIPNPTLYRDPVGGINALIAVRLSEANTQQAGSPAAVLTTIRSRMEALIDKVFHPLSLVAFVSGLGLVAGQETQEWKRHRVTARTILLLWVGGTLLFLAMITPMNWSRYFVPLVPCEAVILGCLVSVIVRVVQNRGRALQDRPV